MTTRLNRALGKFRAASKFVETYHVYIMSNVSSMLYIGVTNDLERRIFEHKNKLVAGFSRTYNLHRLVYMEAFGDVRDAIAREKQLRAGYARKKLR
jgi:putative endonuclease